MIRLLLKTFICLDIQINRAKVPADLCPIYLKSLRLFTIYYRTIIYQLFELRGVFNYTFTFYSYKFIYLPNVSNSRVLLGVSI